MPGISTNSIHAADEVHKVADVMTPIHVTTTYKFDDDPEKLIKDEDLPENSIIGNVVYARETNPNSERVEKLLDSILDGHTVAYTSGLAAFLLR